MASVRDSTCSISTLPGLHHICYVPCTHCRVVSIGPFRRSGQMRRSLADSERERTGAAQRAGTPLYRLPTSSVGTGRDPLLQAKPLLYALAPQFPFCHSACLQIADRCTPKRSVSARPWGQDPRPCKNGGQGKEPMHRRPMAAANKYTSNSGQRCRGGDDKDTGGVLG